MRRTLADLSFEPPEPSRYAIVGSSARQYFWQAKEPQLPRTAVVAIVDDDHFVREALTSYVRSLGYIAMAFECAEDLLKSRRRATVSCLITDLQMPGMTGLELYHRLVVSRTPIPTILITAFPDERARERALQAGVICYLAKPVSEDHLLACIRSILAPP